MFSTITLPAILLFAAKASVVLAIAFGFTLVLRRASAASRHLVWLAAFCGVAALPAIALVAPSWSVPFGFWIQRTPMSEIEQLTVARDNLFHDVAMTGARLEAIEAEKARLSDHIRIANLPAAHAEQVAREAALVAANDRLHAAIAAAAPAAPVVAFDEPAPAAATSWPWTTRIFMLWLGGFVMVGVAFAVGVLRTHLVACAALPASDDLSEEAEILSAEMGIVRDVKVVTWPGPAMPMTWGARKPVVLLPHDAHQWPADRLREVLTHELAHVRRGDWLARLLAAFVCALHWFNPFVWLAARRLRDEQELACDDEVLASGVRPSDYAAHLLEVARSMRAPSGIAHASVAMARPSQLSNRLLAVLDESRSRRPVPQGLLVAGLLAIFVAVPLGAMVPGAPALHEAPFAPQAPEVAAVAMAAPVAPVAVTPPADLAPPTMAAVAAVSAKDECPEGGSGSGRGRGSNSSHSSNSISDDGSPNRTTISISRNGCTVELRMVGAVTFSDGDDSITSIPQGASIRISQEERSVERRYEAAWRGGVLRARWYVDGDEVQETPELRAWLRSALQTVLTGSGYNAVPRMLRAYRRAGLDSALALSSAMSSDYTKRQMLMALIDSARVPAADAARIARQARSMSSDYEKAELLIAVARKIALDPAVQEAMAASTRDMSSDYERRRILTAALERDGLTARAATDILATAEVMSSDYEKAELLIHYLRLKALDEDRRASFFRAVGSMSSDYEKRRVLSAVVTRNEAPNVVGDIATQAERLSSDYEKAELLVQMARRFTTADAKTRIRRAAETISSDYERERVATAVGGRTMRF